MNLPSFRAPSRPWLQPTLSPGGLHPHLSSSTSSTRSSQGPVAFPLPHHPGFQPTPVLCETSSSPVSSSSSTGASLGLVSSLSISLSSHPWYALRRHTHTHLHSHIPRSLSHTYLILSTGTWTILVGQPTMLSAMLISLVQELYLKLTSEHDAATWSLPGGPCCQKIPGFVTRQAPNERHVDPGASRPDHPDVSKSI